MSAHLTIVSPPPTSSAMRYSLRAFPGSNAMNIRLIRTLCILTVLAFNHSAVHAQQSPAPLKTKHVFLLISDGLRWQEVFTGAEKDLIATAHGGNWASKEYLQKKFWRDTPEERRKALFPFIWTDRKSTRLNS